MKTSTDTIFEQEAATTSDAEPKNKKLQTRLESEKNTLIALWDLIEFTASDVIDNPIEFCKAIHNLNEQIQNIFGALEPDDWQEIFEYLAQAKERQAMSEEVLSRCLELMTAAQYTVSCNEELVQSFTKYGFVTDEDEMVILGHTGNMLKGILALCCNKVSLERVEQAAVENPTNEDMAIIEQAMIASLVDSQKDRKFRLRNHLSKIFANSANAFRWQDRGSENDEVPFSDAIEPILTAGEVFGAISDNLASPAELVQLKHAIETLRSTYTSEGDMIQPTAFTFRADEVQVQCLRQSVKETFDCYDDVKNYRPIMCP